MKQDSGEMSREDAKVCLRWQYKLMERPCFRTLRHCERSEAIQNPTVESLWIASLRSQ